ncbi:serine/threonine-protein phosphatase [Vicingaceae bacterium]|nr:serine/threonine-protein phosphatase [Vicingaceae bacterium]
MPQSKKVQLLETWTTILGMFEKLPSLIRGTIPVNNNDMLGCFTDGLTEIPDQNGTQLEVEGIASILKEKIFLKLRIP